MRQAPRGGSGAKHDNSERGHGQHGAHGGKARPIFATVTIGVTHCGAGCVLGDIIGEWLVYGTNATIRGRLLWTEMLVGKCLP